MKSTLAAEKTARIHYVFGASNYVNHTDKDKKFSENSSIFTWRNFTEDIQLRQSQMLLTLKALHVFLKFHLHMQDFIH